MPSVREVRIRDADADSSGDYSNRADRERRVRASANREREDGGVCVAFTGEDVAQTEERGECDTRRDNGTDERVSRAVRANDSAVGRIYERASGHHRRRVIHGKASGGVEAKTGNCRRDTG